jgi:2-keto-4-pentenoate hydratase/2-oxohepta-3-ene-1,7-dioic acid hydratase in catechol pathway
MRLVSFEENGHSGCGILHGDGVFPLRALGFRDAISFIAAGFKVQQRVEYTVGGASDGDLRPLRSVRLTAPVPRPPKILCIGLNYRDHAIESKMEIPSVPTVFAKFSTAVIGPGCPIVLPGATEKADYEAEFAFVIGRRAKRIAHSEWRDYVFGYTILNDVSARDVQLATSQWTLGKSFDTFAPLGPHIVTADEVPDPHALDIRLTIAGEKLQHSNTRELIFRIPELIEYLSQVMTLEPGDIISTGTPAGVGLGRTPPRWLRAGEEVTIEIDQIGTLTNPVIAEHTGTDVIER